MVVSGGHTGTVLVSDLATGTPVGKLLNGHQGPVQSVAAKEITRWGYGTWPAANRSANPSRVIRA